MRRPLLAVTVLLTIAACSRSNTQVRSQPYTGRPIRMIGFLTERGVLAEELALQLHDRGFSVEPAQFDAWCDGQAEITLTSANDQDGTPTSAIVQLYAVDNGHFLSCPKTLVAAVSWQNGRSLGRVGPQQAAQEIMSALETHVPNLAKAGR